MNILNPLANFRWYRRARAGYWGQVTGPFFGPSWVRVQDRPNSARTWEFYPWAKSEMGNGIIDEWYEKEPYYAVPLSQSISEIFGTCDPVELRKRYSATQRDIPTAGG